MPDPPDRRASDAPELALLAQARADAEAARANLYNLFMEAPALVAILRGREGVVELFNPPFRRLWGGRDVIGKPMREAFRELDGQGWFELVERVFDTGEPEFGSEREALFDRDNDGRLEPSFFNFVYQATRDAAGVVDGVAIYGIDVTDLVRARKEAEAAARLRDEFLSIASHELRTPLTTLGGYAQLLRRRLRRDGKIPPADLAAALDAILGQTDRLTSLVGQLLDVTRLEGGALRLDRRPTDLAALVRAVAEATRLTAPDRPIRVRAPDELTADADPARLEQVLVNLLRNAIKYSPDGAPIDVEAARVPWPTPGPPVGDIPDAPAGAGAEIAVRDRGAGIPPERRGRLFERFYQAHADGHRSGMGLGLYISRQIVERHGGEIRAEFPPDGGARFVVRLPLVAAED